MKTEDRIDWLCRLRAWLECRAIDTPHNEKFIEAITDALKKTPRWIPCSERLPEEERKLYWICTDAGCQCECMWTNRNPYWHDKLLIEWHWSYISTWQKVIAWMPLPEPYKESEDKE